MRLSTTCAMFAAAAALTLGVAACGDDDDGDTGGGATTAAATGGAQSPGDASGVTFVEVDAADFSFSPDALDVAAGEELTFAIANTGAVPHTFTVYADEEYTEAVEGADTGNIPDGTVGEFTVTLDAGDYFFRCEIHPTQMEGTITAE